MNGKKKIIYFVLCAVPVAAVLFLLAINNVLYPLLGIIAVLAVLVILKQRKPELFRWKSEEDETGPEPPVPPEPQSEPTPRVYMVLAEREAHGAQRITVNKTSYGIGRGKDNDFVVEGSRIGRHHLRIEYDAAEDACYAVDMGSVNGTYLNSVKMKTGERYRLLQGDRLMIDDHAFAVEYARY